MHVRINRNVCSAQLAFCERCLGKFLRYPMGYERRCFELLEDDGIDELTIELQTDGHNVVLTLNEEQRLLAAGEGWTQFIEFYVPMYRSSRPG